MMRKMTETTLLAAVLFCLMLYGLFIWTDNLAHAEPPDYGGPITCAGKNNCFTKAFEMHDGRIAYCEMTYDYRGRARSTRCEVEKRSVIRQ